MYKSALYIVTVCVHSSLKFVIHVLMLWENCFMCNANECCLFNIALKYYFLNVKHYF